MAHVRVSDKIAFADLYGLHEWTDPWQSLFLVLYSCFHLLVGGDHQSEKLNVRENPEPLIFHVTALFSNGGAYHSSIYQAHL